jgi:peptide/nickel transport system ATP-binding protein
MAVLTVDGLTARYETRGGDVCAVNDVSFQVGQGEIVGIVGESGCGKSATIRAFMGLMARPGRVVAGSAVFQDRDLLAMKKKDLRAVRGQAIGFIAQNPFGALNPILPVGEQFRSVIRAHRSGVSRAQMDEMAHASLVSVGIPSPYRVLKGHAHELSGGMAQRVVIAISLVLDPALLIGDEPTTALDVTLQRQILDLIRVRVVNDGRSMLLVTHDLGVVAQYCDRVVVMYAGKVVEQGEVSSVLRDPAHPYTKALLDSVPRRGETIRALAGRVPDLTDYPVGCPFADRCPHTMDVCRTDAPVLSPVVGSSEQSRTASCHLTDGSLEHRVHSAG